MQYPTGAFPVQRLRRLRRTAALRDFVAETSLADARFVLPLFARPGKNVRNPVASMPGVFQLSVDEVVREGETALKAGVRSVILFGIPAQKDDQASGAYAQDGIVQQAIRALKKAFPELLITTDVCLCEYMSHGHCGIVEHRHGQPEILNDATLDLLARTAVSHAEAGADLVAPSDMMDGRVAAIRAGLDAAKFLDIPIMSYAAKFSSAFYGPFREAAESTPQFGDRRSYQMDARNGNETLREAALDIAEGADIVMVKPALAYLDIIYRIKTEFGVPTAAYCVSGEYSMIKAAAERGWLDERAVLLESHLALKRAGADIIISYAARELAQWCR
ncbi:MAG: porphobilinogen synthase [Limisphaerales bacterium]